MDGWMGFPFLQGHFIDHHSHHLAISGYTMVLIDWIELSNDAEIIELSSDEENVEEYHNAYMQSNSAQHQVTLHDDQTVFFAEVEGGEEAAESGNAEEATASSSVTEKESGNPEEATVSQTCPHAATAVTFPGMFFSIPLSVQ